MNIHSTTGFNCSGIQFGKFDPLSCKAQSCLGQLCYLYNCRKAGLSATKSPVTPSGCL